MHRQVMVDLETLDTEPNAHILSIGACMLHDTAQNFYRAIGTKEQHRSVSNDTLDWWCNQSQEAQDEVLRETDVILKDALVDFIQFYKESGATHIWAHGCDFDCSILHHAFRQHDLKTPWMFWNTEHTRTAISMAKRFKNQTFEPDRQGVYHNALADAQHQTRWMNAIFEAFKK